MAPMSLPPGFRFHPTDEELVAYYLDRKITGRTIELEIIPEVDIYKCEPWDLPERSYLPSKDMEWYFYSPKDRKYPNGSRTNRATQAGYWKATGKDRPVHSAKRAVGMKKTLVYYRGRAPHGIRTNWVMHEYRLAGSLCATASALKDSYALCRIFKKTLQTPKKQLEGSLESERCHVLLDNHDLTRARKDEDENFDQACSKVPSDASSSELTQGTPLETCVADDLQAPFTSDEADSSADLTFSIEWPSNLDQDIHFLEWSRMQYQPPCPPLAIEDFPQIEIGETKPPNLESIIEDYMMFEEIFS